MLTMRGYTITHGTCYAPVLSLSSAFYSVTQDLIYSVPRSFVGRKPRSQSPRHTILVQYLTTSAAVSRRKGSLVERHLFLALCHLRPVHAVLSLTAYLHVLQPSRSRSNALQVLYRPAQPVPSGTRVSWNQVVRKWRSLCVQMTTRRCLKGGSSWTGAAFIRC